MLERDVWMPPDRVTIACLGDADEDVLRLAAESTARGKANLDVSSLRDESLLDSSNLPTP